MQLSCLSVSGDGFIEREEIQLLYPRDNLAMKSKDRNTYSVCVSLSLPACVYIFSLFSVLLLDRRGFTLKAADHPRQMA